MDIQIFILIIFALVLLRQIPRFVKRVKENYRVIIFRLGLFNRIAGPGWVVVLPLIDTVEEVDLEKKIPNWERLSERYLHEQIKEVNKLVLPKE